MTDVLFISRQRLVGRTNGSSVYLLDLAQALRDAGMTPHLLQPAPTVMGRWPVLRLRPEMGVFASHRIRGVVKIGNLVVSRDPRLYAALVRAAVSLAARRAGVTAAWAQDKPWAYNIAIPWMPVDHRFVARHGRGRADVAVADYMFQLEGVDSLAPGTPCAVVMHDLFHARAGGDKDSVDAVTREREMALLGRADAVVAIQAAEGEFVAGALPDTQVIVAPLAAHPIAAARPGDARRLLFVASNTAPNVVGLRWFFEEVWPLVRARRPDLTLEVAGTVARAFPDGGPEGVRFLGLVDDLDALYADVGIVVSPLTFGSGLKIKLVEALAAGKAIVATSVTLQGVEAACAGAVAHADEAEDFAGHVVRLADDDAARAGLAEAALAAARSHFAPAACYGRFTEWVRTAAAR